MLKIAHISDLHFCDPTLAIALKRFSGGIAAKLARLGQADFVTVHVATDEVVNALRATLLSLDPDVIVISGDITTFGDEASFNLFVSWCKTLAPRTENRSDRRIVVVPGNHDALKDHFTRLKREYVARWPALVRLVLRNYIALLNPLEPHLAKTWSDASHLSNFRAMMDANKWLTSDSVVVDIPDCPNVRARLIPFTTTGHDPFWMNLAETQTTDWERLQNDARRQSSSGADIKLVIAHHNPIAPPSGMGGRFTYAYNGMPEGTLFLTELQRAGVDFILHGHQHEFSLIKFDYDHGDAGHAFAVGSDSSSDPVHGGFNLLTIADPNSTYLQRYRYKRESGFLPSGQSMFLPLERHRPIDAATLSARYELKLYLYPSRDELDEIAFAPVKEGSRGLVYMSGRHFKTIREQKFGTVRQVLNHAHGYVRLLLVDPILVQKLLDAGVGIDSGIGDLWGRKEELARLLLEAQTTLDAVQRFFATLSVDQKRRIDVRKAHTLLPFGAYVRHPDQPWGNMVVKILPIGAMGDLDSPVLRLNRRATRALYDYYLHHLKYLFLRSKHVVGDWHDDADLRDGMEPDLLVGFPS